MREAERIWTAIALAAYLAALAFGVLLPDPAPAPLDARVSPRDAIGLIADAIRNLILFLPFGWLLRGCRIRLITAAGIGLLLSAAIEVIQSDIPGRHTSIVDIVTNTLGTALGAILYSTRYQWLFPAPEHAVRLARAFGLLFIVVLMAGSQLLRPAIGGPDFYGGLRPELGNYDRYLGQVLEARLGSTPITPGRLASAEAFRRELLASAPISIRAQADPRARALAPLVTVHDTHQREVLLVASQERDLFVAWQTRAVDFGFERPIHRWRAGLAGIPAGREFWLQVDRTETSASLSVAGKPLGRSSWTPGRLWSLLFPAHLVPVSLLEIFDASAIALLALPCLFFARGGRLAPALLALFLLALPWLAPIAPAGLADWLGLAGGILLARASRWIVRQRLHRPQDRPDGLTSP